MKNIFATAFVLFSAFLFGCQSSQISQVGEVPESPVSREEQPSGSTEQIANIKLAWSGKHSDAGLWTKYALDAIDSVGRDLLNSSPEDQQTFCPRYSNLTIGQRREFYAQLLSKVVQFESAFKPGTSFTECSKKSTTYGDSGKWFPDRQLYCIPGHKLDGGVAVSRGLGQMSMMSAQSYGCAIEKPEDLHDPQKNISCMVRVMNRFVPAPRLFEGKTRGHNRIAGKVDGGWKGLSAYWSVMREPSSGVKESYMSIKTYVSNLPYCK